MCAQDIHQKRKKSRLYILNIAAIIFGIFSGLSGIEILQDFGLLISDIFTRIFKFISLPVIVFSIIATLSQYSASGSMSKVWKRIIFYTLLSTVIAASIACLSYLAISPSSTYQISGMDIAASTAQNTNYFRHLREIIPTDLLSPFLQQRVVSALLIGLVIGLAIRYIKDENARQTVTYFFKGLHQAFLTVTAWVIVLIPLGLYGFITATFIQLKDGANIAGLGEYLLVIILANFVQGFIILPLWLKLNNIQPFLVMKQMLPALSVAFFSKSSTGTLPVTMDLAERNLKIKPEISKLVLPLCTTINMNGCAAFIFTTVIYLLQNSGVELTMNMMLTWILIATVAAIGNAGVPMGCFFLSASLLVSMDIPIVLLGMILPFYTLIDMVETALNVWSDICVAKVVDIKVARQ